MTSLASSWAMIRQVTVASRSLVTEKVTVTEVSEVTTYAAGAYSSLGRLPSEYHHQPSTAAVPMATAAATATPRRLGLRARLP